MTRFRWFTMLLLAALSLALAGQRAEAQEAAALFEPETPAFGWRFNNGAEFPGARGSLAIDQTTRHNGQPTLRLDGDFSAGGNYVEATRPLTDEIATFSTWLKLENAERLTVRFGDSSGQSHQFSLRIDKSSDWQRLTLPLADFFARRGMPDAVPGVLKYEYWGGKKDGKWHGPARYVSILLSPTPEQKVRTLWLGQVQTTGGGGGPLYAADFEAGLADWKTEGSVTADPVEPFQGRHALRLAKPEASPGDPAHAASPSFPIAPGTYEVKAATRTDVASMDNSYNCTIAVEALDASGKVIATTVLAEPWRKTAWKPVTRRVTLPEGTAAGRFSARINKETPGRFWIDGLAIAPVAVAKSDDRIRRLTFTTVALGNLLLPTDSRLVTLNVLSTRALDPQQQKVSVVVTDYWGAEQTQAMEVPLADQGKDAKGLQVYEGTLDLATAPLETGRYYELHGSIPRGDEAPFRNHTSLAILPEAPANAFKPEQIPWTSRTWDNRVEAFVRLTHRLGIRICGVWGGWSAEPPYKPHAPQLKLVEELGMGWLTGLPSHAIEQRSRNWEKYDEKALREGARNFVREFGHVRPMVVNLGNEPHNKGDQTKVEINAYRILYQAFKEIDPSILVVGTSVGTGNEAYFANGFGEWCDAYDFHIYEDAMTVRRTIEETYPRLFEKYGHAKPIWSTELGLNSQGLARLTVAGELYKKTANFFAGGGASMSWFGFLYPDPEGTGHDSFASAHNVFDSRYSKYAPKLDAIAYYNAVNSILDKKFVADRLYDGGTRLYLFRDTRGESLLIAYRDKGRADAFIPLPGVTGAVQVTRIDGTRTVLQPQAAGGVGVTVSEDPVLLQFSGGPATLPQALAPSPLRLASDAPAAIVRAEQVSFAVEVPPGTPAERVTLKAPPFWLVTRQQDAGAVRFSLMAPETSNIREAEMLVGLQDEAGQATSEISYRPAVTGLLSVQVLPVPAGPDKPPAAKVVIRNNSPQQQEVSWDLSLTGEQSVSGGSYGAVGSTDAYFADTPSGIVTVEGRSAREIILPMSGADLLKVYRARATLRDSAGRTVIDERPLAGFVGVKKARAAITLDGSLDDAAWQQADVRRIDQADQFYFFKKKENQATWEGAQDLSADLRFTWDDEHLYMGVSVTDDIAGPIQPGAQVWQQDGLQLLIDPMRTSSQKVGKYDYGIGDRPGGAMAQCFLAADGSIQLGDRPEIRVATRRGEAGSLTYEVAIPWRMVAPFRPTVGANLGLTMIVNEDDGHGRDSFLTWFGNAHNKDIDKVGDLVLTE